MKIKTLENQELRFCISKKTIKYVLKRENLKILFFHTFLFRVQYDHAIVKNLKISLAFLLSFYLRNHCAIIRFQVLNDLNPRSELPKLGI